MNTPIAEVLEKLGFDESLDTSISTHILLQLPKFTIPFRVLKDKDVIRFNLMFGKKGGAYTCLCYDAFLRKEIVVPDVIISNIHIKDLDEQMALVNWIELFHKEQEIGSIIDDLKALNGSKEGKEYSEQLQIKYWSDTPLEGIMNLSLFKSRFEISQRFYFFDDGKGISIDEAYRFLNNKWLERQLRKKTAPVPAEPKPVTKGRTKKSKSSKQ